MIRSRDVCVTAMRLVFGGAVVAAMLMACSEDRSTFGGDDPITLTPPDASAEAGECPFQCSLDGRSVVRSCTGEVVETCAMNLACGAGLCQEPCAAATADRSSNGCEFYLQPPEFTKRVGRNCYAAYVVNAGTTDAVLTLEFQGKSLDLSKSVFRTNPGDASLVPHTGPIAAGESAIVFVADRPAGQSSSTSTDVACPPDVVAASTETALPDGPGFGSSFHMTATAPVGIATIYPFGGAKGYKPTATLLLPVSTWSTQHFLFNAWERNTLVNTFVGIGPSAQIVASEDDTEVTLLPNHDLQNGSGFVGTVANVPVSFNLNKGQVLQLAQGEELSGSIVTSTKPTSIFGGHECMLIPSARDACDIGQQQLLPFEQWGSEYVSVGYRPRQGNPGELMPYRIMAARDGTRLDYDPKVPGGAPLTMSAGQVVTFWAAVDDAFVVRTQDADHPIYLAAYMTGSGRVAAQTTDILGSTYLSGAGDPEYVNVIPSGQYLSSYSFYADPTYEETSLVVIRAKSHDKFEDVWLECAGNLPTWKPVGTRGDYEWTRVDLARNGGPGDKFGSSVCQNGLQRMKSDGPFTATLWGWGYYASYAYPGGLSLRKLVQTPLPPVH